MNYMRHTKYVSFFMQFSDSYKWYPKYDKIPMYKIY